MLNDECSKLNAQSSKLNMAGKPWYHEGLRFRCTSCGACCTGEPGHVWVNKAEIEAMAGVLDMDVPRFEKQYVRLVGIRKSLIEFAGGDCAMLDRQARTCRVYSVRPRQCRTWPFWASNLRTPRAWEETCRDCPGANQGPVVSAARILSQIEILKV